MATQGEDGIPLTLLGKDQQRTFRLLELPPGLLTLLTSENPPVLQLKSTEGAPGEAGGNAVLCTSDKTFSIRQKNSSNTVYILNANEGTSKSHEDLPEIRLEAISESQSTLETTPVTRSTAAAHITEVLPKLTTASMIVGSPNRLTKSQLFANLPFSTAECEAAYRELVVLEYQDHQFCVLPSAAYKLVMWYKIFENAQASGIDLTGPLLSSQIQSLSEGTEDDHPGFFEAVLHAVSEPSHDHRDVDHARLLRWTGINAVEYKASQSPMAISTLKGFWKDYLPEQLREQADASLISDRTIVSEGGKKIMWKDYASDLTPGGSESADGGDAKATLGKRKWHEKFKPAKKGG